MAYSQIRPPAGIRPFLIHGVSIQAVYPLIGMKEKGVFVKKMKARSIKESVEVVCV